MQRSVARLRNDLPKQISTVVHAWPSSQITASPQLIGLEAKAYKLVGPTAEFDLSDTERGNGYRSLLKILTKCLEECNKRFSEFLLKRNRVLGFNVDEAWLFFVDYLYILYAREEICSARVSSTMLETVHMAGEQGTAGCEAWIVSNFSSPILYSHTKCSTVVEVRHH
jgi:hypothetical protein